MKCQLKKAFSGKNQASIVAAILASEPQPISAVQPMSPPALDRVVKICITKDPDERWQTAHDVKLQLQWIAEGGSQAGTPAPVAARRKNRERILGVVAALAVVTPLLLGWLRSSNLRHEEAVAMGKQKVTPNYRRRSLRLPDLDHCKRAVLNSLGSV